MNDMSQVIIPKSDQLNSDSLVAGPITITITDVEIRPGTEQPVTIHYAGENGAPWKPCKSMSRILVAAWGPDAKAYVGRSATLYRDPSVKWGGMEVGGIRVSHLSNIERDMVMALTATKGKRAPYTVRVMHATQYPGLTLDQARTDIEAAETLDDLKAVWTRKSMQPFRAELQGDLDARKAALAEPDASPDDNQRSEANNGTSDIADTLIARIEAAAIIGDVIGIEGEYRKVGRDMLEVADQDRVETAIEGAKAKFKGAIK